MLIWLTTLSCVPTTRCSCTHWKRMPPLGSLFRRRCAAGGHLVCGCSRADCLARFTSTGYITCAAWVPPRPQTVTMLSAAHTAGNGIASSAQSQPALPGASASLAACTERGSGVGNFASPPSSSRPFASRGGKGERKGKGRGGVAGLRFVCSTRPLVRCKTRC